MKQDEQLFCMKQFKPVIVLIVVLTICVIGWTTYQQYQDGTLTFRQMTHGSPRYGAMPIATAPPIKKGAPLAHPDWGPCKNCHDIIGAGAAVKPAATAMSVATAPPIQQGAALAHPDWGPCKNCHDIIGAGAAVKPAATAMSVATAPPIQQGAALAHPNWGQCTNCHDIIKPGGGATQGAPIIPAATVAPPIGVWLKPITQVTANKMGLDNADGVLVTGVYAQSPASAAGISAGDIILMVGNSKVESVPEAIGLIAMSKPGEVLKLRVLRNKITRKVFVQMPDVAQAATGAPVQSLPVAPSPTTATRVAVAATSGNLSAQVAPSFGDASVFIIYEPFTGQYSVINNPSSGTQGGGMQAAAMLTQMKVGAVIAGNVDPFITSQLRGSGAVVYTNVVGPITNAVDQYKDGKLVPTNRTYRPPNVLGAAMIEMFVGKNFDFIG